MQSPFQRSMIFSVVAAGFLSLGSVAVAGADTAHSNQSAHERKLLNEGVINDAFLDAQLEARLLANPHLNSFAIDTRVMNRVVTLTGTVESAMDRVLAGELAKSLEGVQGVRNELAVKAAAEQVRVPAESSAATPVVQHVKDARTTAIVKGKLLASPYTHGLSIYIDTRDNVVTLSGTVNSDEERQLAELLTRNTGSVTAVQNNLVVAN